MVNRNKGSVRYFSAFLCLFFISVAIIGQRNNKAGTLAGEKIYLGKCASCHGKDGLGKGKRIPPLANSDYLENNLNESIRGVLFGQQGEIMVNGVRYDKRMRAIKLTDQEVADVMNYVRNSWGNQENDLVTIEQVARIRKKK